MRGWLFVSLGLLACTMGNPAFGLNDRTDSTGADGADGGGGPDDDGIPDGGETGDGGSDDDGHTGATGDSGTGDATSEPDVCDYGKTPPLKILLEHNWAYPCPLSIDGFFHAVEVVDHGWLLEPCASDGCWQCYEEESVSLSLWPLAPQDLVGPGCLKVQLEALHGDGDVCHYDGVTIWRADGSGQMPVVVGSANGYGIPDAAAPMLSGLQMELEKLYECPCHEVEDVPNCCESEPPAAYKLYAGSQYAYPGDWVPVELGPAGQEREYQFHNVQSYFPGVCEADVIMAWALVRP